MAIGTFGKCVFETSDKRILTFKNFLYRTSARTAVHEVLEGKPKLEHLGPALDEVTFTITLRAELGINVWDEILLWRRMIARGSVERLIIGRRPQGTDCWKVLDCSEAWNIITNSGGILSATMDVTLQEYG